MRLTSDGRTKIDNSMYTGSLGVAYVYWKLLNYFKEIKESKKLVDETEKKFLMTLEYNASLWETDKGKNDQGCASFY
jgi:hypothetical protein